VQFHHGPAAGGLKEPGHETVDEAGGRRLKQRGREPERHALMGEIRLPDALGMGKKPPVQHVELHRLGVILFASGASFFPK